MKNKLLFLNNMIQNKIKRFLRKIKKFKDNNIKFSLYNNN